MKGGFTYLSCQICTEQINLRYLWGTAENAYAASKMQLPGRLKFWFRQKGRTLSIGLVEFTNHDCISKWLETVDKFGTLDCFCTVVSVDQQELVGSSVRRTKFPSVSGSMIGLPHNSRGSFGILPQHQTSKMSTHLPHKLPFHPLCQQKPILKPKATQTKASSTVSNQVSQNIPTQSSQAQVVLPKPVKVEPRRSPRLSLSPPDLNLDGDVWLMTREDFERGLHPRSTPRVKHIARKKTPKKKTTPKQTEEEIAEQEQKRESKGKEKADQGKVSKPKAKRKIFHGGDSDSDSMCDIGSESDSSSGYISLDIEWLPGEEEVDLGAEEEEELFLQTISRSEKHKLLEEVHGSLRFEPEGTSTRGATQVEKDVAGDEIRLQDEFQNDSDELRSLGGSSDDEEQLPYFNAEVAFKQPIEFQPGTLFDSADVLM